MDSYDTADSRSSQVYSRGLVRLNRFSIIHDQALSWLHMMMKPIRTCQHLNLSCIIYM